MEIHNALFYGFSEISQQKNIETSKNAKRHLRIFSNIFTQVRNEVKASTKNNWKLWIDSIIPNQAFRRPFAGELGGQLSMSEHARRKNVSVILAGYK